MGRGRQSRSKGLSSETPVRWTPLMLRVARVRLWTRAVAAIKPSTTGIGSGTFSRPHSSAIRELTGRMWSS